MKAPANSRRTRVGLAASNADRVITLSDDWIPLLGHHTQIAALQLEMNLLARARFEMNALESAKSDKGSTLHCREFEIDLCTTSSPARLPVFVTVTLTFTGCPRPNLIKFSFLRHDRRTPRT